jgi:fluoroquinolone transport system permease protein
VNRLLATILLDFRLQFRNGFYYASLFVAVVLIIMLRRLPPVDWARWWPAILLENLIVNGFYFMAGLVLLEKAEGTLEAQVVAPLRSREYLAAKVVTLALLSWLEASLIVVAITGFAFNWLLLAVALLFLIAIYALYGFFVIVRYDSISEFILPSVLWTLGFSVPLLYLFDLWPSWLVFLHPLQGPVLLMRAAFERIPPWQVGFALVYTSLWVWIAYIFSRRAFHRFVIATPGQRYR